MSYFHNTDKLDLANLKSSKMESADALDMFNTWIKKVLSQLFKPFMDQLKVIKKLRSLSIPKKMKENNKATNIRIYSSEIFPLIILKLN